MTAAPQPPRHLIPDLPTSAEILPWLQRLDEQRWYTNFGPLVQEFEREIAKLAGAEGAPLTTMATGHHALECGLRALNLPAGGKVLMPAVTFPSCPFAAIHAGLQPVFADIDAASWQLTPEIARRIAAQTNIAAVMPVAIYGVPVDAAAWDDFTKDTGIAVIIDAAAAFGAQKVARRCLTAFSFHATKPFGIGEGGALFGPHDAVIARARECSSFGSRDRIAYSLGTNAKMSEFHAAVGLAQVVRWDGVKARRASVLEMYKRHLADMPVQLQAGIDGAIVSILMISGDAVEASRWIEALQQQGIAAHRTYLPPLYRHPAFMTCDIAGAGKGSDPATLCPNAENMMRHAVGLPFHGFMAEEEVAAVCSALKNLSSVKARA